MNKILIVAKRPDRELLQEMLEEWVEAGGEILITPDENSAIALLESEHPGLILLDESVRQADLWNQVETPVVILAKHPIEGQYCLTKPIKRHQLLEMCQKLLPPGVAPRFFSL